MITNMPLVFVIDARIDQTEFKNRGMFRDTYSAFGRLKKLALDPGSLSECSGSDWDKSWPLKMPITWISTSHFFVIFFTFCSASLCTFQP